MFHIPFKQSKSKNLLLPQSSETLSWSYGLNTNVSSLAPQHPNYFTNCPGYTGKHWLVGVQAESSLGSACAGVNAQSMPINEGGPLSLAYGDGRIRLRTDLYNFAHPCPGEVWTWFSIMDHVSYHGGPLPDPLKTEIYTRLIYNEVCGTEPTRLGNLSGISRTGVTFQGFWNNMSHLIDVLLYVHPSWGDAHPDSDVIQSVVVHNQFTYTTLDGRRTDPVCSVQLNEDKGVLIPIHRILQGLMNRGIVPAISGASASVSVGIFTEVHSLAVTPSCAADLLVKELRVF